MIQVEKIREYHGHTQAIYTLSPALEAGHFLSAGAEGLVVEWDIETGEGRRLVQTESPVYSLLLIPERKLLVLGLRNGELAFVDLARQAATRRVQLHQGAVFDLQPFPDQQHLLASGEDGALSVWSLDRLDHLHYQRIAHKPLRTLAFRPGGQHIAVGGSDHHIQLLDLGLSTLHRWHAHQNSVFRVCWDASGDRLLSTGRDAHLRAWAFAHAPTPIASLPAHLGAVNDLLLTPEGWFYTASMDKSIKYWDPGLELRKVADFNRHGCHWNGVNRLLLIGDQLLSCGDDRRVMRWTFQHTGRP